MRAYRRLLARPAVARQAAVALVSRTTPPVLTLTLLAAVHDEYADFVLGSLLVATYSVAFAVALPITGRLADAHGPRLVLRTCLAVNLLAYGSVVASLARHAPPPVLFALTALLGASLPPSGPITRSGWAVLVPAGQLPTAYALDAVITETGVVAGPLLAALALVTVPPPAGLLLAAVATGVGALGLSGRVLVARRRAAPRFWSVGPLRSARVRVLLAICLCTSASAGATVIAATRTARSLGAADAAGVLLAVLGVGAVASAALYGGRGWRGPPLAHLTILCSAGVATYLVMAASCWSGHTCAATGGAGPVLLAALFLLAGATQGPRDAVTQLLLAESAGDAERTEAFSWLVTAALAGFGLGTAVAGQVADRPQWPLLIFLPPAVACAAALALRFRLAP